MWQVQTAEELFTRLYILYHSHRLTGDVGRIFFRTSFPTKCTRYFPRIGTGHEVVFVRSPLDYCSHSDPFILWNGFRLDARICVVVDKYLLSRAKCRRYKFHFHQFHFPSLQSHSFGISVLCSLPERLSWEGCKKG